MPVERGCARREEERKEKERNRAVNLSAALKARKRERQEHDTGNHMATAPMTSGRERQERRGARGRGAGEMGTSMERHCQPRGLAALGGREEGMTHGAGLPTITQQRWEGTTVETVRQTGAAEGAEEGGDGRQRTEGATGTAEQAQEAQGSGGVGRAGSTQGGRTWCTACQRGHNAGEQTVCRMWEGQPTPPHLLSPLSAAAPEAAERMETAGPTPQRAAPPRPPRQQTRLTPPHLLAQQSMAAPEATARTVTAVTEAPTPQRTMAAPRLPRQPVMRPPARATPPAEQGPTAEEPGRGDGDEEDVRRKEERAEERDRGMEGTMDGGRMLSPNRRQDDLEPATDGGGSERGAEETAMENAGEARTESEGRGEGKSTKLISSCPLHKHDLLPWYTFRQRKYSLSFCLFNCYYFSI